MVGFVFKVQHDVNKGPLSFVRVYEGQVSGKDQIYICEEKEEKKERIQNVLLAEGGDFKVIHQAKVG